MVGWHHRLNGHEFEQPLGAGDGQGSLACCRPQSHRVRHDSATEQQRGKTVEFSLLFSYSFLICGCYFSDFFFNFKLKIVQAHSVSPSQPS